MPEITLYSTILSPPCRAVLMVGAAVGIDFDVKEINLLNDDHRKEDFVKKPIFLGSETKVPNELLEEAKEGLEIFDKLLEGKQWLVGDSYTIADICCVSTVSSMTVLLQLNDYPNVLAWLKRCEKHLPGYEKYNETGNKMLHEMFQQKIANE
ncbi:hypothetical protein M0804_010343 [Polistes exclamans]|nr:hypothetical protein M0804_010343 [Polistes exclamans]